MRRGTPGWPQYPAVESLRAGGRSRVIGDARLAAEHQCGFWGRGLGPAV